MDNKVQDKRYKTYYLVGISHQSRLLAAFFSIGKRKNIIMPYIPIFQSHKLVFTFENKTCKQRL